MTPATAGAGMTIFVVQLNFRDGDGAATCHYFDRQVIFVVLTNFRLDRQRFNLFLMRRRRRWHRQQLILQSRCGAKTFRRFRRHIRS